MIRGRWAVWCEHHECECECIPLVSETLGEFCGFCDSPLPLTAPSRGPYDPHLDKGLVAELVERAARKRAA